MNKRPPGNKHLLLLLLPGDDADPLFPEGAKAQKTRMKIEKIREAKAWAWKPTPGKKRSDWKANLGTAPDRPIGVEIVEGKPRTQLASRGAPGS